MINKIVETFRLVDFLLKDPKNALERAVDPEQQVADIVRLLLVTIFSSALYGVAMGAYVGGIQILYAAIKMPLFFLATLSVSFAAMHILQQLDGARLNARQGLYAAMVSISITGVILAGFAPISIFYSLSFEPRAFYPYRGLMLMHIVFIAIAGIVSLRYLKMVLNKLIAKPDKSWRVFLIWIFVYSFTGCQMAWFLRPFMGDYEYKLEFMRQLHENTGIDHNFYVAVFKLLKEMILGS